MLIMFRARNYSSFKDDVILDMRKSSYKEHMTHIHKNVDSDIDVLKTVAIYGANASGKSNLINAIGKCSEIIRNNFFEDESVYDKSQSSKIFPLVPFSFSEKIDDSIEFEIVFKNEKMFQYGFEIRENMIISEWLSVDGEEVFDRKEKTLSLGKKYKGILKNYSKFRNDRLYIGTLDYFVLEDKLKNILSNFKDFFDNKLNVYIEVFLDRTIKGTEQFIFLNERIKNDFDFREKISNYLSQIDTGICGLDVEDLSNGEDKIVKTIHKVFDNNGNEKSRKKMDLKHESAGTLRFISLIGDILEMIESGGVFIVDEMSSKLHPLVTKFIVDLFQSEFNTKTQLIFTTHDISLMTQEQFRRDEIVIIDKDEFGVSTSHSLSDLKIRKDAVFLKDYLKGKYGGLPIIQYWSEDNGKA